jgi:hypothetical protein
VVKKDGSNGSYVTNDLSKNLLPQLDQTHLQQHLTPAQFLVLGILLNLLQSPRLVLLEPLASAFGYPITTPRGAPEITEVLEFASTNNQSDLVSLHHLLVNYLLPSGSHFINCDRTHLAGVISIYSWFARCDSRAIPLFWSLLPKP